MKMFKFIFGFIICVIVFAGCNKNTDNPKTKISALKYSNLAGAKAAFITGNNNSTNKSNIKSVSDDYNDLKCYKVGIDDQTQTVTFTDDEGNTVPVITDYVQSLSSKYAVMRVYNEETPGIKCVFVIRKSDGKLFTTSETLENSCTYFDSDPLGCFTWDGGTGEGIDYVRTKNIKSDPEGNVYYFGGGYTLSGTLHRIYEKNGNVQFATIDNVGEYYSFNTSGDLLAGAGDLGDGLVGIWITAGGQKIGSEWLVNMGPEYPRIHAGSPFALSFAPNSFFTIDQIFDDNSTWQKSVLSEYTIRNGEIVREVVHEFIERISQSITVTSRDGIGLVEVVGNDGFPSSQKKICVIKNVSEGGINYFSVSESSHSNGLMNPTLSDRYVYCFNPNDLLPNHNTISRFDPQTGVDAQNYYTLPGEYALQCIWVTHDDVITVLAKANGRDIYIEVNDDGIGVINDTYNNEKVILRSAF